MKKRTKIILNSNCKKDAYCNREEYFLKYGEFDKQGCFKKLKHGAPLVINIDGTYYYYDKLLPYFGCVAFDNYRREMLSAQTNEVLPPLFIWR